MKAKQIKVLSQKAYRECWGLKCPMCKSTNIIADQVKVSGNTATQPVACNACDSYWTDIWILKSFDNLNEDMTLAQHQEIYKKACEVEEINFK